MRPWITAVSLWVLAGAASAQDSNADLAKKLSNPVSNIISVPFQANYDCCFGPSYASRFTLNIQPVIPFSIGDNLNLITRTIVPIIDQGDTAPGVGGGAGLGDTTQSFFFSPKTPQNGIIWGAGPVFVWPTGSSGFSARQWSAGPTFVVLKQQGHTTFGLLASQVWSYAGAAGEPHVSQLFLQPFYAYQFADTTTLSVNTETSYNWVLRQWTVPVNFGVSHIYKVAGAPVSFGAQVRGYAVSPNGQPSWGLRLIATLIIPK